MTLRQLRTPIGFPPAGDSAESPRGATPFAGFTGLMPPTFEVPFDHSDPVTEVGWRLQPNWWGLGIATEAANASVVHGFAPSRAVMTRIGMRADGEFDHPRAKPQDSWRRHVLYRMHRDAKSEH